MQIYEKLLELQIANCKMLGIKPTLFFYSSRTNLPKTEIGILAKVISYDIIQQMQKHRSNSKPILEQLLTNTTFNLKDIVSRDRGNVRRAVKELEDIHFLLKIGYHGYDYIVNPFHFNVLTFNQSEHLSNHLSMLYEQRYGRPVTEADTPEFGPMLVDILQLPVRRNVLVEGKT